MKKVLLGVLRNHYVLAQLDRIGRIPGLLKVLEVLRIKGILKRIFIGRTVPAIVRPLISVAPHNLRLYEYFIRKQLKAGARFITSEDLYGIALSPNDACILIRHDVDYCPDRLAAIIDVERRLGVVSDVHVIVDKSHYDPHPYAESWRKLAAEGYSFGLHTLAPSYDDFFSVLRKEIRQFSDLLGFAPKTFSVHGVCPSPVDWQKRRQNFLDRLAPRMASFGFDGSHNFGGFDSWVEDSGRGGEFAYLDTGWTECVPVPGKVIGVLVHPDHWVEWPVVWQHDSRQILEHPHLNDLVSQGRKQSAEAA